MEKVTPDSPLSKVQQLDESIKYQAIQQNLLFPLFFRAQEHGKEFFQVI